MDNPIKRAQQLHRNRKFIKQYNAHLSSLDHKHTKVKEHDLLITIAGWTVMIFGLWVVCGLIGWWMS